MLSQHPADQLIRELIRTRRAATTDEIDRIVRLMASAPFDPQIVPAPRDQQGVTYLGRTLGMRDDALFVHLVKRVVDEQQWAVGTTAAQYVDDLRRAIQRPDARVIVYPRRGGPVAATISQTSASLAIGRQGAKPEPFLLVIYSADRGVIVTGYQFSSLARISNPEEALWLR